MNAEGNFTLSDGSLDTVSTEGASHLLNNNNRDELSNVSTDTTQSDQIPNVLREVLLKFTIVYLLNQPEDIIDFGVEYFTKERESRGIIESQNESTETKFSPYESNDENRIESIVNPNISARRKSVFAEAYDPEADTDDDEDASAINPKTDDQRARLMESIKNVLMFRSLEREQINKVLDAMFERRVKPGEFIIRQGEDGDNFYVIESGIYKVTIDNKLVHTYNNSGIFGELALLHNTPRAASIQAETTGLLWAMDRKTFRRLLLKSAFKKRKIYESLLNSVPMLKDLQNYERMKLADVLITKYFNAGDRIIKQGDEADGMYFIEQGTVIVKMQQNEEEEVEIAQLSYGQYFGELALVIHQPRAASVYAESDVKVAFLEVEAFERLLGSYREIMQRNIPNYEEQLARIFGNKMKLG